MLLMYCRLSLNNFSILLTELYRSVIQMDTQDFIIRAVFYK